MPCAPRGASVGPMPKTSPKRSSVARGSGFRLLSTPDEGLLRVNCRRPRCSPGSEPAHETRMFPANPGGWLGRGRLPGPVRRTDESHAHRDDLSGIPAEEAVVRLD